MRAGHRFIAQHDSARFVPRDLEFAEALAAKYKLPFVEQHHFARESRRR